MLAVTAIDTLEGPLRERDQSISASERNEANHAVRSHRFHASTLRARSPRSPATSPAQYLATPAARRLGGPPRHDYREGLLGRLPSDLRRCR